VKVELFNFEQIINRLLLPFPVLQPPLSPRQQHHLAFISEFNVQLLYLPSLKNVVANFLSHLTQTVTGSVAAMSSAYPVDFEEMAAEQHRYLETQWLLGGTSLELAFRQTGAQCLTGDVSTGTFRQHRSPQIQKSHF
jgi:hypothetical protein